MTDGGSGLVRAKGIGNMEQYSRDRMTTGVVTNTNRGAKAARGRCNCGSSKLAEHKRNQQSKNIDKQGHRHVMEV
jgi:hypothetical protein